LPLVQHRHHRGEHPTQRHLVDPHTTSLPPTHHDD
jgi:hypothetical protein